MRQRIFTGTIAAVGALILSACAALPGGASAQLGEPPAAAAVGDSITGDGGAVQARTASFDTVGADGVADKVWCGSRCNGRAASTVMSGLGKCSADARIVASGTLRAGWPKGEGAPVRVGVPDPYMAVAVYYSPKCETMWTKVTNKKAIGRSSCNVSLRSFTSPYFLQRKCPSAGTSITTPMVDAHRAGAGAAAYTVVSTLDSRNRESSFLYQR